MTGFIEMSQCVWRAADIWFPFGLLSKYASLGEVLNCKLLLLCEVILFRHLSQTFFHSLSSLQLLKCYYECCDKTSALSPNVCLISFFIRTGKEDNKRLLRTLLMSISIGFICDVLSLKEFFNMRVILLKLSH